MEPFKCWHIHCCSRVTFAQSGGWCSTNSVCGTPSSHVWDCCNCSLGTQLRHHFQSLWAEGTALAGCRLTFLRLFLRVAEAFSLFNRWEHCHKQQGNKEVEVLWTPMAHGVLGYAHIILIVELFIRKRPENSRVPSWCCIWSDTFVRKALSRKAVSPHLMLCSLLPFLLPWLSLVMQKRAEREAQGFKKWGKPVTYAWYITG